MLLIPDFNCMSDFVSTLTSKLKLPQFDCQTLTFNLVGLQFDIRLPTKYLTATARQTTT